MRALLHRLGAACGRWSLLVVAVWIVVLLAALWGRHQYGGDLSNDFSVSGSESQRGISLLDSKFPSQGGYAGTIVFHAASGKVSADSGAVSKSMSNVADLDHVITASDPLKTKGSTAVSKDGSTVNAPVSFSVSPTTLDQAYLDDLDDAVAPARSAGLEVEYGGGAGQIANKVDDRNSEILGVALAFILLLIMFRSVVAAALPLAAAAFGVATGISVIGIIAASVTLPTMAPTVATLLGLGVAIDYALFLVARHREQLDASMDLRESVASATATSGSAIVVAGGTVMLALLGLYIAGVSFVGALGLSATVVVGIAIVSSLTFVPALLRLAGNRIQSRRERRSQQGEADASHENTIFARWGKYVSVRPLRWAILATLALLILAAPLFSMRLGQLDAGTDPTTDSSRRAYDLIDEKFGAGVNGPLVVVTDVPQESKQKQQAMLSGLQKNLQQTHDVASVSPPAVNDSGTVATFRVIADASPQSASTQTLVSTIRTDVLDKQSETGYVVGTTASNVDFTDKVSQRMPWLIAAVVLIGFALLTAAFRSVVIGIKAAILNLLSIGAAYGVIVAIFQWGWGSSLIGIDETVPIPAYVPMFVFAIVFGLSMDYEVFLLSRVHDEWLRTGDAATSVAIGLGATGRVITTAAAVMVAVFTSFVFADDPAVKMLAVGMAVAVLIDASIVRMLLVPAIMSMLGARAWWAPPPIRRPVPPADVAPAPGRSRGRLPA